VHAESAHEVSFHEPESFCQQQRVGHLIGDALNYFAPKFLRHGSVKRLTSHGVFSSGGNIATAAGLGEPKALVVLFREGHGCVKANDRELARD